MALAMLVLVAGLVTAYFSRALQERRNASSSASQVNADLLATSAAQMVLTDFLNEMEAGSDEIEVGDFRYFRPLLAAPDPALRVRVAPSMFAQRSPEEELSNLPNLVKLSRRDVPFFDSIDGYDATFGDGPARAASINTETPSLHGRSIPRGHWNLPQLMTDAEFAAFTSPDWIYVNRAGENPDPTALNPEELNALGHAEPGNSDFVLGRYAYAVYDVGGLLDVNVLGNLLSEAENQHRGRLHHVNLPDGFVGIDADQFRAWIDDWRWPGENDDGTRMAANETWLNDPQRSFVDIENGHQAFVGRLDLIQQAQSDESPIPPGALPYLTSFSRSLNAPHWRPDPAYWVHDWWQDSRAGKGLPGVDPAAFNPDIASVRFADSVTLGRGSSPELEVAAGTPVMPRRFPLGKLEVFDKLSPAELTEADEADLLYYFGLVPTGQFDTFRYVHAVSTPDGPRLARLEEVAGIESANWMESEGGEPREPNFFEILRAVISAGSLGITGGNSMLLDMWWDQSGDLQALQIGANAIDQWDSDDIPTTIQFPSGDLADPWDAPFELYGIENLPYFHQFALIPHRPAYERDLFHLWAVFDLWNPHQNATNPPEGVQRLRIRGGTGSYYRHNVHYMLDNTLTGYDWRRETRTLLTEHEEVGDLNRQFYAGEELIDEPWGFHFDPFPGATGFSEVRTVGGGPPPESPPPFAPGQIPGLLLVEENLSVEPRSNPPEPRHNAGVPPYGIRSADLQEELNEMFEYADYSDPLNTFEMSPYTANRSYELTPTGAREYPPGTTFTGLDEDVWTVEPSIPSDGVTVESTLVYAPYATKADNNIRRFFPSRDHSVNMYDPTTYPGVEDDDGNVIRMLAPTFHLEVQVNGQWKTYQLIEEYFRRSIGTNYGQGVRSMHPSNLGYMTNTITHHSELTDTQVEGLNDYFYGWSPLQYYARFDPRGRRFGYQERRDGEFGRALRQDTGTFHRNRWSTFRHGLARNHFGFEQEEGSRYGGAGFATNLPAEDGALNNWHPARYEDRDRVIRPGDAYFGGGSDVSPMTPGRFADRPVILNRPFRSAGDLGYVFRDLPWKSLDFASRWSADLGLLDVFSLDEPTDSTALVAGKINLNTRRPEVLTALLDGTLTRFGGYHGSVQSEAMASDEAGLLADELIAESVGTLFRHTPYAHPGDIVPRVLNSVGGGDPLPDVVHKNEREAAVRTLAALGDTRTWNFMIDVVAQTGRVPANPGSPEDFMVSGERRYWVHVAMDRVTGEILALHKEEVHN